MKKYPLISQKLYQDPWCVMPEVLASFCEQFKAHVNGAAPEAAADEEVGPKWTSWTGATGFYHPQVEVKNGLALVAVHGVLGKHLDRFEMQCGGYDVGYLTEQMGNIADDEEVRAVIIDFRTPGGTVTGIETAARSIVKAREAGKKVFAYTSDRCASAGYWLASACDEIHAERTAAVGSISTIIAGIDSSGAFEQMGLERKVFATGELKATGMPGKPWTKVEEDAIWARVKAVDADFKGFIRDRRGLTDDLMQGGVWEAKHAPPGIVDSVQYDSLQDFVEAVYQTLR